ncbi:MAG: TlyA family rRNA (cytidine-2'-O)-methyltransferase [Elusimicrobia bacterium HGW-Elusimicrobia-1]|jgi:23S rRNA (cytidine1920-2'-O)/16S rRNA (cytidine1409-2'-O)-methyltransferase|nr:MAG: TlyA family rRNA (cytidine-2'-O)-methyltransferase [Elusimicrobia bacterium HGW-Elusimicrobia-1]
MKTRLDRLLVEKGLSPDIKKAAALIMAGAVTVDGRPCPHAGSQIASDADVAVIVSADDYVSRSGAKLEGALDDFAVKLDGLECCDVGSSTGGFTQCMLRRGAAKVYAFDVGKNLMHERVARDPRVKLIEDYNFRRFSAGSVFGIHDVPSDVDKVVDAARMCRFVAADVSFISAVKILYALADGMKAAFEALVLVKPQFELPASKVPGGVVRDEKSAAEAVEKVRAAASALGFQILGAAPSRLKGARGNREYFLYLDRKR